jgi:hypothetical protein
VPGRSSEAAARPRIVVAVHEPALARNLAAALERAGFDPVVVHDDEGGGSRDPGRTV